MLNCTTRYQNDTFMRGGNRAEVSAMYGSNITVSMTDNIPVIPAIRENPRKRKNRVKYSKRTAIAIGVNGRKIHHLTALLKKLISRYFGQSNENKMSDGGRGRASLGVELLKSSQKWSVQRSAVRSIAWLGLRVISVEAMKCE